MAKLTKYERAHIKYGNMIVSLKDFMIIPLFEQRVLQGRNETKKEWVETGWKVVGQIPVGHFAQMTEAGMLEVGYLEDGQKKSGKCFPDNIVCNNDGTGTITLIGSGEIK